MHKSEQTEQGDKGSGLFEEIGDALVKILMTAMGVAIGVYAGGFLLFYTFWSRVTR